MRETSDSPEEPVNDLPGYADLRIGQLPPPPLSPSPAAVRVETPFTTLHSFSLRTGKGRPWLTLTIRSRATSTKYLPLFCDHDSITGELLLDLPATERVKSIVFIFKGSVTLTGQDEDFFIREETHLWLPPDGASTGQLAVGRHSLAVDFPIPTYIPTASRRGTVDRLPPTYTERASPVYVNYQLGISVRRPGISPNRKLVVGIGYLPREMAGRPSPLRLLAYQAGTPLLGPDDDLTGWRVLPPVIVGGTVFSSRIAMVEYTLAIASPLSFVVNSPIPLFLTIKSEDRHTLDLFASSQHEVCLTRVLSYAQEVNSQRSSNTFPTPVAQAVFWSHVQENSGNTRTLQGEIHIPKGTNPSFTFRKISLSYQLALLSPKIAGFAMTKTPDGPLVSEAVIVTVAAPKDVRIISQLPPRYAESGHGPNFNVTSGLLESGNMRFIHVHAG